VSLPTVSANDLATDGATTDRTSFNLKLTECAGYLELEEGTASAFFAAGDTVDLTSGRLKNTEGDDYAQNVQLQLRDGSNAQRVIKVGDTAQVDDMGYVDITSGSATLPYLVEYYATGVATPGLVESSVVYALQYK
jgi:major type 1 subunit fimbrin (pilin)